MNPSDNLPIKEYLEGAFVRSYNNWREAADAVGIARNVMAAHLKMRRPKVLNGNRAFMWGEEKDRPVLMAPVEEAQADPAEPLQQSAAEPKSTEVEPPTELDAPILMVDAPAEIDPDFPLTRFERRLKQAKTEYRKP
jgi:hypothetical protein